MRASARKQVGRACWQEERAYRRVSKKTADFRKKSLTSGARDDIIYRQSELRYAPVAQLDRVFGYEPKGRGFESLLAYQINRLFLLK